MKLYLAGPDIFFPDARDIGARKKALCHAYGFQGLYPLDAALPVRPTGPETAMAIYRIDTAMMDQATAIVANLTPFRGPSADPGTVFELAWMLARGKPAFGYSDDPRPLATRTPADGNTIEDFGLAENLMIDCALRDAGTPIVTPEPGQAALSCFERCLAAARQRLVL
jgi:nucleoside 2-deoxyribosyltransferase